MTDCETIYVDYSIDLVNYDTDKINVKPYITKKGTEYKIYNYTDKSLCDDDPTNGLYRSIIVSHPENEIVCFSPRKSMPFEKFKEQNPDITSPNILVNEIIEGTMINLFYDKRISSWEIATKGAIGGNYWFYRTQYDNNEALQYTFREMFLDVFGYKDTNTHDINDLPFLQDFSKEYSYSFVLQHPVNHIVLSVVKPIVYLVAVYHLRGDRIVTIPSTIYEEWNCFIGIRGLIEFPVKFYTVNNYHNVIETYCSANSPHTMVGLMITNLDTGKRTALENVCYAEVRELRGNNPNLQYQYLCLRRINKVMDFLKYFPNYKKIFYKFYKQYEDFITNLHSSYISYYIRKTGVKISKKYFPIIQSYITKYIYHHLRVKVERQLCAEAKLANMLVICCRVKLFII
jgi:hypothetical protein